MKILIVDDSNDKIAAIITELRMIQEYAEVDSVSNAVDALRLLREQMYNVVVVDLFLPIRDNEDPKNDGGAYLVKEISRNKSIKAPTYILGLTQYLEHINSFSRIWPVIIYDPSNDEWKTPLREAIQYNQKLNGTNAPLTSRKSPVFVEGITDKRLIAEAFNLYLPDWANFIEIRSDKSAGASWVTRQLVVWSHSLYRNSKGEYIKAFGIYDGDNAGKDAIQELRRIVKNDGAESQTFRTISLSASFAKHLIPIIKKGLLIPITLEEMFESEHWQHALENDWTELRTNHDEILKEPKEWDKYNQSFKDFINGLDLSQSEVCYLKRFKVESKELFSKYVLNLSFEKRQKALQNFEPLIREIQNSLGI